MAAGSGAGTGLGDVETPWGRGMGTLGRRDRNAGIGLEGRGDVNTRRDRDWVENGDTRMRWDKDGWEWGHSGIGLGWNGDAETRWDGAGGTGTHRDEPGGLWDTGTGLGVPGGMGYAGRDLGWSAWGHRAHRDRAGGCWDGAGGVGMGLRSTGRMLGQWGC